MTGLACDETRDQRAVTVAVGEAVGGCDEVTAGLNVGQPRARPYPGVDHRDGLALAAAVPPGAGQVRAADWFGLTAPGSLPGDARQW